LVPATFCSDAEHNTTAASSLDKNNEVFTETPTSAFLTVADVQRELRVSEDTVRRMLARGDLAFVRAGRRIRIHRDALEAWRAEEERRNRKGAGTQNPRLSSQNP